MGKAQFGEIRIYLNTGLCILIDGTNGRTNKYATIEADSTGYVDFTAENTCSEDTEVNIEYKEYYGEDITGITISLADENEQDLPVPHNILGNTLENLKIKIVVDAGVEKNISFLIRVFAQSVPA